MRQGNPNKLNIDFINKDRAGVGEMLPLWFLKFFNKIILFIYFYFNVKK